MGYRGGVVADGVTGTGTGRLRVVRGPVAPAAPTRDPGRDDFRTAVSALDPGPLRELLTAVAYARDETARTGSATPSTGRWLAVVAAAQRAAAAEVRNHAGTAVA
jgi:hypothetical protein